MTKRLFTRLSSAQVQALNYACMNLAWDGSIPAQCTLNSLVGRGYLELVQRRVVITKVGSVVVEVSVMPIELARRWMQCAKSF